MLRLVRFQHIKRNHRLLTTAKTYKERRLVAFSKEDLYSCVADVSSYSQFVPWCKESKVIRSHTSGIEAELVVGFGIVNEKYLSTVELIENKSVVAVATNTNILEHLRTEWKFSDSSSGSDKCWVNFQVDFKFKSAFYNQLSEIFFHEVVTNMIRAFESRCKRLVREKLPQNKSP